MGHGERSRSGRIEDCVGAFVEPPVNRHGKAQPAKVPDIGRQGGDAALPMTQQDGFDLRHGKTSLDVSDDHGDTGPTTYTPEAPCPPSPPKPSTPW